MYHNDFMLSVLASEKQARYLSDAEKDRLAAEFRPADPAHERSRVLILVAIGVAGALFRLLAF